MNLELAGIGIDPASQLDIEGNFYVTQIGPQFTDNVLRSLDPTGTDKSIQDTRKLLNWGYKPKLLSFEIKHGYLYPTIHLVKGKFLTKLIPLKLSGGQDRAGTNSGEVLFSEYDDRDKVSWEYCIEPAEKYLNSKTRRRQQVHKDGLENLDWINGVCFGVLHHN